MDQFIYIWDLRLDLAFSSDSPIDSLYKSLQQSWHTALNDSLSWCMIHWQFVGSNSNSHGGMLGFHTMLILFDYSLCAWCRVWQPNGYWARLCIKIMICIQALTEGHCFVLWSTTHYSCSTTQLHNSWILSNVMLWVPCGRIACYSGGSKVRNCDLLVANVTENWVLVTRVLRLVASNLGD